jgi:DNA-binding CsgD family transcriptional regulator
MAGHTRSFRTRVLTALGEREAAIRNQAEAVDTLRDAKAPLSYMHGLSVMSNVFYDRQEFDYAVVAAEEGLREAERVQSRPDAIALQASLVACWQSMGRMKRAAEHYAEYLRLKSLDSSRFNTNGDTSLTALYPELTPTELTICSLLKRRCRSQEIADQLHVSVHTVETHRRNIRRKIGLPRGTNLVSWLLAHTH